VWPLTSLLLDRGLPAGTLVPGYLLERQFCLRGESDDYLLISSYDCPYDESTEFTLLDRDFRIRGRSSLGGCYTSFGLDEVAIVGECELRLRFDDDWWRLEIRQHGSWFRRRLRLRQG
jgi:hypothetical protein